MEVFDVLKQALKTIARVLTFASGLQEGTRKQLVADLSQICDKCHAAYDAVLLRLDPIKDESGDPSRFAQALRDFAADAATRAAFKPQHLCGEVDSLLVRLESNLDPLKYSIDYRRIQDVRIQLHRLGTLDGAMYQSYNDLTRELDSLASQVSSAKEEVPERVQYALHTISGFEDDLRDIIRSVRETKDLILHRRHGDELPQSTA